MTFGERLKEKRTAAHLSQQQLANMANISLRSIQNYECGKRYPNSLAITKKLANILSTTTSYLLAEEGQYILEASEKGGSQARREVRELVEEISGLFAGGELDENDRDAAMQAITEAYFIAKQESKKYANKNKKTDE